MTDELMWNLGLGAGILGCTIGLHVASRVMKRNPDTIYELVIIAFGLAMMIMVPSFARSLLVGGLGVIVLLQLEFWFGATVIALVVASWVWLPGGISALLLAILAVVGVTQIRAARQHLVRLSRARTLVANDPVPDEVELTGKIRAVVPTNDPVYGKPCAMWRITPSGHESQGLVEIRGETGSAIIDPMTVRLDWSREPKVIRGDEAKATAEKLRFDLDEDGSFLLYVLPEDTECYVIGTPSWEMSPANTVGLYRDAPILPTFRATPERPARFVDRSEAQLRSDHTWALLSWGTWGAMCGAIAFAQIAGLA